MRARALLVVILAGCGPGEIVSIEIATLGDDGIEGAVPEIVPPTALARLERRGPGRYRAIVTRTEGVVVRATDACPVALGAARFVRLRPLFTIEGERAQIGFGAPFELRMRAGCAEAERASLEWTGDVQASERGRVARGRTPAIDLTFPDRGVVPISPRTRGTRVLRLAIELDGQRSERKIVVHAAARATGVPSVAVRTRTYLAGTDLEIVDRPAGSQVAIERLGDRLGALVPDVRGRYTLGTREGPFTIYAGSHAATDLDCGRSTCHREVVEHATASPMTGVLARNLEDPKYTVGCAIECHAVGEPGIDDGGLVAIASAMAWPIPRRGEAGAWAAFPRELRRLGGVGCTGCHGPGAIPEPGARDRILSADVCATCHDAPPRYDHFAAWRSTHMGRRGSIELTRDPCARCHTTAGFLDREGERVAEIACAACHAPHAPSGPSLTRQPEIPDFVEGGLREGAARVCVACHSIEPSVDMPTASAVALSTGRGAFSIEGELHAPAPHARLERGCLACHGTGAFEGIERGANHAFRVDPAVCGSCHEGRSAPRALEQGIAALRELLGPIDRSQFQSGAPVTALARARWNLALVANDRGAWAHAGSGAIAVLDAARALAASGSIPARD